MDSLSIYNLVRALSKPYVGAHIEFNGMDIKVWETSIGNNQELNIEPGKVINVVDCKIEVKTYDGSIWLMNHEFDQFPLINNYI